MDIKLRMAVESDLEEIREKAKQLDLDCSEMRYDDFVVACKANAIAGFGRIKKYSDCMEISTLGVVLSEQKKGIGSMLMKKLLDKLQQDVFVVCVIPEYFSRFGFMETKIFPEVLKKKCEFCHSFGYDEEKVFVMKKER